MIVYADLIGCEKIINLPDSVPWEFILDEIDEKGQVLRLKIGEEDYVLGDVDHWCSGRANLSALEVICLYEDLFKQIQDCIKSGTEHTIIDLIDLENNLISEKYGDRWLEKGYVTPDPVNGAW